MGDLEIAAPAADDQLLAVHEALDALTAEDPEKAEVVKLRDSAGFTFRADGKPSSN